MGDRIQRLVSSPYMFNMLGNPAYEDPKLWTGLVSGAAVPYPLRNTIMAQRTPIPYRMATTGTAMSPRDFVAMKEYDDEIKKSPKQSLGPFFPNHHARHRLHNIFQTLNNHMKHKMATTVPTPHYGARETDAETEEDNGIDSDNLLDADSELE